MLTHAVPGRRILLQGMELVACLRPIPRTRGSCGFKGLFVALRMLDEKGAQKNSCEPGNYRKERLWDRPGENSLVYEMEASED